MLRRDNGILPAELHDIVIQHIEHGRDMLLAYAAVCRSWENGVWPYRKRLFRRVSLTQHNINPFLALLRVSPRVIPCIQAISINCPTGSSGLGSADSLAFGFLDSLPNVVELRLEALLVTPTFTSSISGLAARVRELEVAALCAEDPLHFVRLVGSFTSLKKLCIKDRPELAPRADGSDASTHDQSHALRVAAYDELPLQPLLEGVSSTLETIRFGEQAICKSVKCVCFDSEAAKLWVARKLKPIPHARHLSAHPNLRHVEFETELGDDGWGYDIEKLLSDGFIQNPNLETIRIRWDVTKHYEELFEGFSALSVSLLESLCEGISARAAQFCKLRAITFEAFEGPKTSWQMAALPLDDTDRSVFHWLVGYISDRLPTSEDDTVRCYSARGLDMSKMEIEVRVRVKPSGDS